MRRSLFALILAGIFCALCACQSSPKQMAGQEITKSQPAVTPSPSPDKSSTEAMATTQPDDNLLVPVQIKKGDIDNSKDDYELRIEYPQLKHATTHHEKRFNQYVKALVAKEIRGFEAFCRQAKRERKKKPSFHLGLTYTTEIASNKRLCLDLRWESYTGYLNSDWYTTTINFDLEKGRELKLADLFKPKSNYLETLSKVGLNILRKTCVNCDCAGGKRPGQPLAEGFENPVEIGMHKTLQEAVAPKMANFVLWGLTSKGIAITFDEYEIAPGCAGIISIILPFEELKPAIRDELLTSKF
ncbi:MAG: DUF3298 domain-containing protein [Acidobacteria bacterium]|nr:DUF3298 domain-containing protein [Acidobacteriota bacterium]